MKSALLIKTLTALIATLTLYVSVLTHQRDLNKPLGAITSVIEIGRTENSIVYQMPDGKHYLKSYGYPINTLVAGKWETTKEGFIDTGLVFQNRSQRFNGQVSKKVNEGDNLFVGTSSVTTLLESSTPTTPLLIDDNTKDIEGNPMKNKVLFSEVWANIDVRYTAVWFGNKRDIIVKNSNATTTITLDYCSGNLVSTIASDVIHFGNVINVIPTIAFDSMNKKIPFVVTNTKIGNCVISKIVYDPTGAIYPITIDPNTIPVASSGDGYVRAAGSTSWATFRDAVDGDAQSTTETAISCPQDDKEGANWFVYRCFFPYDTSAIGATDIVNEASTTVTHGTMAGTQRGMIVKGNQASMTALSTTNGDFSSGNFTSRSAFANASGVQTYSITGNLSDDSLIIRAGNTKLRILGGCDQQNIDPATGGTNCATGTHYTSSASSENGTPSSRPVLSVMYTVAAGAAAPDTNVIFDGFTWIRDLIVNKVYASLR